jgi:uncharacterized protein YjeT (DUF2065 family)
MWHDLLAAFGLMLVLEGILPFLNPRRVRELLLQMTKVEDRVLRVAGLGSMGLGLLVLYLARGFFS